MASDNDVSSCESDPNFAVICAFIEKFGMACGLSNIDFVDLQGMLENTEQVSPILIDLHVKLMRKARKSVTSDKWEKIVVKICHSFCTQDAWEVERFGYKNAKLSSKIRILKELLEMQFDYFTRFKTDVNKIPATELRTQPLGRDKMGNLYWYLNDDNYQIRVYKEDPENGDLELVAKDKHSLLALISDLNDEETKPFTKTLEINDIEDSNSNSVEKPLMDTGQCNILPKVLLNKIADDYNKATDSVEISLEEKSDENISQQPTIDSSNPEHLSYPDKCSPSEEPKITLKLRPLADLQKNCTTDSDSSLNSDEQPLKRAKIEKIRIRNISNGTAEISEVIEDPPVIVRGEGSGLENEGGNSVHLPIVGEEVEEDVLYVYGNGSGLDNMAQNNHTNEENHLNKENYNEDNQGEVNSQNLTTAFVTSDDFYCDTNPIVGEEIVETIFYVSGHGSGAENLTGNDNKAEDNDLKSNQDGSVHSENRTLKTSDNSVSQSDISEGEVVDNTVQQQEVPTSPVKNPYKLGTILDTKTDKSFVPKIPIKKSRWDVANSELDSSELETPLSSDELRDEITQGKVKDLVEKFEDLADTSNTNQDTQLVDSTAVNSTFFFGPGSSPFKYSSSRDVKESSSKVENHKESSFVNDIEQIPVEDKESDLESNANGIIKEDSADTCSIVEKGVDNIQLSSNDICNSDIENVTDDVHKDVQSGSEETTLKLSSIDKIECADITDTDNSVDVALAQEIDDTQCESSADPNNVASSSTFEPSVVDVSDVKVSSTSDSCTTSIDIALDEDTKNTMEHSSEVMDIDNDVGSFTSIEKHSIEDAVHTELSDVHSSMSCDLKEPTDTNICISEEAEAQDNCVKAAVKSLLLPNDDSSPVIEDSITSTEFDNNLESTDKYENLDAVDSTNSNIECSAPGEDDSTPISSTDISCTNILKDNVPILPPENPVDDIYSAVDSVCDNMLSDINAESVSEDVLGEDLSSEDVNIGTGEEPSNVIDFDDLPAGNLLEDDTPVDILPVEQGEANDDSQSSIKIKDDIDKDSITKPQLPENIDIDDILQDRPLLECTLEDSTLPESKSEDVSLDAMLSGDIVTKDVSSPENSIINEVNEPSNLPGESANLDNLVDDLGTNQIMNNLLPDSEASTEVPDMDTHMNDFPVTADSDITSSVDMLVQNAVATEVSTEKSEGKIDTSDEDNRNMVSINNVSSGGSVKDTINEQDVEMPFDNVPAPSPPVNVFGEVPDVDAEQVGLLGTISSQDKNIELPDENMEACQDTSARISDGADKSTVRSLNEPCNSWESATQQSSNPDNEMTLEHLESGVELTGSISEDVESKDAHIEHSSFGVTATIEDTSDTLTAKIVTDVNSSTSSSKNVDDEEQTNEKQICDTENTHQDIDPNLTNKEVSDDKVKEDDEHPGDQLVPENEQTICTQHDNNSELTSDAKSIINEENTDEGFSGEKLKVNEKVNVGDESTNDVEKIDSSDKVCELTPNSTITISPDVSVKSSENKLVEESCENLETEQTTREIENQPMQELTSSIENPNIVDTEIASSSCGANVTQDDKLDGEICIEESKSNDVEPLQNSKVDSKANENDSEIVSNVLDNSDLTEKKVMLDNEQLGSMEGENQIDLAKAKETHIKDVDGNKKGLDTGIKESNQDEKDQMKEVGTKSEEQDGVEEKPQQESGQSKPETDCASKKEDKLDFSINPESCDIKKSDSQITASTEQGVMKSEHFVVDELKETVTDINVSVEHAASIQESSIELTDSVDKSQIEQENKRRSTRYSGKDYKSHDLKEKSKKPLPKAKQPKADKGIHAGTHDNKESTTKDNSELIINSENIQEDTSEDFQPVVIVERTSIENKHADEESSQLETRISTRRSGRFAKENKDVCKEDSIGKSKKTKDLASKEQHNEASTDSDGGRRKSDGRKKRGRPREVSIETVENKLEHLTDEGSDRPVRGGRRSSSISTPKHTKHKEEQKAEQPTSSKKVKLTEEAKPVEVKVSRRGRPRNSSPHETKQKLTAGGKKTKSTLLGSAPQRASRGTKGLRSSSSGSTPVASPQVVSVECDAIIDSCSDVTEIQERDPLAVTESDPESSKASFSAPHNDSSNSRTRRSLRKRGLDSPENIPDSDEALGKKPKLKGRRSTDLQLRRSIEEKKRAQVVSSSEDDVSVLTDLNSTQENKTKPPAKRGRKSKTPQKKGAHIDSPNSETPQPSKKKKVVETRNSKSKKR